MKKPQAVFVFGGLLALLAACASPLSREETIAKLQGIEETAGAAENLPASFSLERSLKSEDASIAISCTYSLTKRYYHYKESDTSSSETSVTEHFYYVDPYSTIPIYVGCEMKDGEIEDVETDGDHAYNSWADRMAGDDVKGLLDAFFGDLTAIPSFYADLLSNLSGDAAGSYSSVGEGDLSVSVKMADVSYAATFKDSLVAEESESRATSSRKTSYFWNNAKIYYPSFASSSSSSLSMKGSSL